MNVIIIAICRLPWQTYSSVFFDCYALFNLINHGNIQDTIETGTSILLAQHQDMILIVSPISDIHKSPYLRTFNSDLRSSCNDVWPSHL